jgi:hypothetical protein
MDRSIGTPSPPSQTPSPPPFAPSTPSLSSVLSPEDEEMLFHVMNANVPVEEGNFWFPNTHDGELPALDSILAINNILKGSP